MKRFFIIIFVILFALLPFSACETEETVLPKYGLQYKITYHAVLDGELTEIPQDAWEEAKNYPKVHIYGEDTVIDDLKSEYTVPRYGQNFSVVFEGWFLDEACTQEFQSIYRYKREETVVYAKLTTNIVYLERNITYKAVLNGWVMEIPQDMFIPQTEYPNTYLEWKSEFGIDGLQKILYYKQNGEKVYYDFCGWYLDQACTQSFTGINKETNGDITIYAQLKSENAIEYKAIIDGKIVEVPKGMWQQNGKYPVSYLEGTSGIKVDSLTKTVYYNSEGVSGYRNFEGWYLDVDCTQKFEEITSDMRGNLTLYAKVTSTITGDNIIIR